jgi:hypothetical protein
MKTLKNSIIAAVLTISSLTIAQAQETSRKGWDGTIKGRKQTQGTTFGERSNEETTSETQTAVGASRKGYQYYMAQSDMATTSVKPSNNKHPDLMKRQLETAPESENVENDGLADKIKLTPIKSKELTGTVSLLK